jgi:mannosyltransferase
MNSSAAGEAPGLTSESEPESAGLPHRISVLLLFAASIAIRFWCLVCKPFWFDEAYSVELARIDLRNFLHLLWWREANMSLYYVLLRGWMKFGQSPFFVRSLSVVLSVATLAAVYWLGRLLYDRRVALLAAALFAFSGYSLRYAQEARSYSLFVLLATLSSAFLIAWLRHSTRGNRIAYVIASVLAVYAHFYALLLIAAQWMAIRWGSPGERVKELRSAWITIGIAVLPLLTFIAKTGAGPIKWIPRPGLRDVADFFKNLSGGNSWILLVAGVICCGLAVAPAGRRLMQRANSWEVCRLQFLLLWLAFPVALTVVLSFARPVFLPRYLIFTLPALIILIAAGLAQLRPTWLLGVALTGVLFLNSAGVLYVYAHDFDTERDASGIATNFILDHSQPGDAIIFHIAATRVAYEFFRSKRAGENTASPQYKGQLGPEIVFPYHGAGLDYRDFTGKPAPDLVHSTAASHARIWVMLMNNGPSGKPDVTSQMIIDSLSESYPKTAVWDFPRVEVRLYSR